MAGGLAAGYGMFTHVAGRFLYPAAPPRKSWVFVARVADVPKGSSLQYIAPSGATIAVARRESAGDAEFVALGSTCPHLGCQVHWEPQHARFFCPCHNGAFDSVGRPISGPPKDANQSLPSYPWKVENGLLYLEVSAESSSAEVRDPSGARVDGCKRDKGFEV